MAHTGRRRRRTAVSSTSSRSCRSGSLGAAPSQPMSRTVPSLEWMEKDTLLASSDQVPGGSRSEPSSAMFGNA